MEKLIHYVYQTRKRSETIPLNQKTILHKIVYNGLILLASFVIESILKAKYLLGQYSISPLSETESAPIVSITTFPKRINTIWIVLHSIYAQTHKPSKVLLILAKEEFPNGLNDIPKNVANFIDKGLEIVFVKENLRPHNKYFYALQEYRNRNVITLDDDLYYWPDTIERLLKLHDKYPANICANSVNTFKFKNMTLSLTNEFKPYYKSAKYMARGVCGVLYPSIFRSEELFNVDKIKELSLNADDLWLKAHAILLNIDVVVGDYYPSPMFITGTQKSALRFKNVDKNENEIQWIKLSKYYNIY